eukprot:7175031-Pyramimonas_sp.AAC.1
MREEGVGEAWGRSEFLRGPPMARPGQKPKDRILNSDGPKFCRELCIERHLRVRLRQAVASGVVIPIARGEGILRVARQAIKRRRGTSGAWFRRGEAARGGHTDDVGRAGRSHTDDVGRAGRSHLRVLSGRSRGQRSGFRVAVLGGRGGELRHRILEVVDGAAANEIERLRIEAGMALG